MSFSYLTSADRTDTGRKRKNNEDALLCLTDNGIFCVADGMGGAEDGEIASLATVDGLVEAFSDRRSRGAADFEQTKRLVAEAVLNANEWIREHSQRRGISGIGSTVVILAFDEQHPQRAAVLHAGDSRAYRLRGNQLKQLSADHSLAAAVGMDDERRLGPMFRAMVTRAVGVTPEVDLEETPVDVEENDLFLLCSDGLSGMIPYNTLQDILIANGDTGLNDLARLLVDKANEAGGTDNITVVLVRAGKLPTPTAPKTAGTADSHDESPEELRSDQARTEDPAVPPPSDSGEPPASSDSSEPATPTSDLECATPSDRDSPDNARGGPDAAAPQAVMEPMFEPVSRAKSRFLAVIVVAGGVIAAGIYLFVRHQAGSTPEKTPEVIPDQAARQPAETGGEAEATKPAREPLSDQQAGTMRATLQTRIDATLITGEWGRMEEHIRKWSGQIDDYLDNSGRKTMYTRWLSMWKKIRNGDLDAPTLHRNCRDAVLDVCAKSGFAPPEKADVSWPATADAKADMCCKLIYLLQRDLTDNVDSFIKTQKAEMEIPGDKPVEQLEDLWSFVGDQNGDAIVTYLSWERIATNELHRLEMWLTACGDNPIPVHSIEMVPPVSIPRITEAVGEARSVLSKRLALIPERINFWRQFKHEEVDSRLDRMERLYSQTFGGRQCADPAIWRDGKKQNVIKALLMEASGVWAIAKKSDGA